MQPKWVQMPISTSHWALPSTQSLELNRDDYVKPAFAERVNGYKTLFEIVDPISGQRAMTVDEIREAERLAVLEAELAPGGGEPGTIIAPPLTVACGRGALRLTRVQRPGRRAMTAEELARGFRLPIGTRLG